MTALAQQTKPLHCAREKRGCKNLATLRITYKRIGNEPQICQDLFFKTFNKTSYLTAFSLPPHLGHDNGMEMIIVGSQAPAASIFAKKRSAVHLPFSCRTFSKAGPQL